MDLKLYNSLSFLRSLGAILTASFHSFINASCIQNSTDNSVTEVYILYTTSTEKHNGVFLKGVTDTRDVGRNFHTIGKTYAGDLSDSGVWLTGSLCGYLSTNASFKWREEFYWSVFQNVKGSRQSRRF